MNFLPLASVVWPMEKSKRDQRVSTSCQNPLINGHLFCHGHLHDSLSVFPQSLLPCPCNLIQVMSFTGASPRYCKIFYVSQNVTQYPTEIVTLSNCLQISQFEWATCFLLGTWWIQGACFPCLSSSFLFFSFSPFSLPFLVSSFFPSFIISTQFLFCSRAEIWQPMAKNYRNLKFITSREKKNIIL